MNALDQHRLKLTPDDIERASVLKAAIVNEIESSPNGLMTYGTFAERSMYGYGEDIPGYYTQSNFSPNNTDGRAEDSFGTMVAYPGTGAAVGEIVAIETGELLGIGNDPLTVIEVGGGDGTMMFNLLSGATRIMRADRIKNPIRPIMIDKTAQLLARQKAQVERASASNDQIIDPVFIHTGIENLDFPPQNVGAVVTNELLDMLPFEVAAQLGEPKPGLMYVRASDGELDFVYEAATDDLADLAADTLRTYPNHAKKSFQPELLTSLEKLVGLILKGVVITMDYGPDAGTDVQVMRSTLTVAQYDQLKYPGLFDISVIPDWNKVTRWGLGKFGARNVESERMDEFIASSESYPDPYSIVSNGMRKRVAANGKEGELRKIIQFMVSNYRVVLFRK